MPDVDTPRSRIFLQQERPRSQCHGYGHAAGCHSFMASGPLQDGCLTGKGQSQGHGQRKPAGTAHGRRKDHHTGHHSRHTKAQRDETQKYPSEIQAFRQPSNLYCLQSAEKRKAEHIPYPPVLYQVTGSYGSHHGYKPAVWSGIGETACHTEHCVT